MKKILKQGLSFIISIAMFITLLPCTSFAADNIQTVYMDVTYGQTEARSMLNMINEFN